MLLAVARVGSWAAEERIFTVINASDGLTDNSAQALVCTRTGRMVIATLGNLNFYNGLSFSNIFVRRENIYALPNYRGSDVLFFDLRHHLWLKSPMGLACTDLISEHFVQNVDSVLHDLGCPTPVLDLFSDSGDCLWSLCSDGLYGVEQQRTYAVLIGRHLQDVDVMGDLLLTFYGPCLVWIEGSDHQPTKPFNHLTARWAYGV